jgi:putative SOS response-associated peptidase YedK
MCGRARLASDYSEIKMRLKFAPNAPAPNFEPNWNLASTEPMLVAIRSVDGERVPRVMKWGLIPHWAKGRNFPLGRLGSRLMCPVCGNKDVNVIFEPPPMVRTVVSGR